MFKRKVTCALEVLEAEGEKCFSVSSKNKVSKWTKIGLAVSHINGFSFDMLDFIYAIAEDWNFHAFCEVLDFVFRPKKHMFLEEGFRERLTSAINKTVEVRYLDENREWQTKKLAVAVIIKEV
jgi:hypothetical protein